MSILTKGLRSTIFDIDTPSRRQSADTPRSRGTALREAIRISFGCPDRRKVWTASVTVSGETARPSTIRRKSGSDVAASPSAANRPASLCRTASITSPPSTRGAQKAQRGGAAPG